MKWASLSSRSVWARSVGEKSKTLTNMFSMSRTSLGEDQRVVEGGDADADEVPREGVRVVCADLGADHRRLVVDLEDVLGRGREAHPVTDLGLSPLLIRSTVRPKSRAFFSIVSRSPEYFDLKPN